MNPEKDEEKKRRFKPGDWDETSTVSFYDTPEHQLWHNVLLVTIDDYKKGVLDDSYLKSDGFKCICDYLDADPDNIRENLDKWRNLKQE